MSSILLSVAPPDRAAVNADHKKRLDVSVIKRAMIQTALEKSDGNITLAAELLGVDRRTLQKNCFWQWHPSGRRMDGQRMGARREHGSVKARARAKPAR